MVRHILWICLPHPKGEMPLPQNCPRQRMPWTEVRQSLDGVISNPQSICWTRLQTLTRRKWSSPYLTRLISNRRVSLRRMRSTLFLQAAVEYPEESSVSMNTFSRDTTARIILPFLKMNTGLAAGHMLLSVMIRAGRIMMQRG